MERVLDLVLMHKWYVMQRDGVKTEEYREIKPYWDKRLIPGQYTHVRFRDGYTSTSFTHRITSLTIGFGRVEWGAPADRMVYIIKHEK